jgi:ArsR family transcriptional regulator, arsenate/arsenite/antimonite-responsive transcriptional repressor
MAFSKSHLYPKDDQIVSAFAKAFSHAARLAIIRKLVQDGPCSVAELLKNHPISKPTLSKHLKCLREVHLVTCREKYPHTLYRIDLTTLKLAKNSLRKYFKDIG